MKTLLTPCAVFALFFCFVGQALASNPAGIVLTVEQGAWAERNGTKVVLSTKDPIQVSDVLVTDAHGRVQVIFADDTTISLGANTQVAVTDFVFEEEGKKPSFAAQMAKGAARFVTGRVVEQNRDGFAVETPQATVGIRGTTFAITISDEGITSIVALNITPGFPISVANNKTGEVSKIERSGAAVDAAAGGNSSYQTPPGQFSQSSAAVNGTAVAAADSAASSDSSSSSSGGMSAAGGSTSGSSGSSASAGGSSGSGGAASGSGGAVAASSGSSNSSSSSGSSTSSGGTSAGGAGASSGSGGVLAASGSASGSSGSSATSMASGASQTASAGGGTLTSSLMTSEPAAARDLANSAGMSSADTLAALGMAPGTSPDHSNASGTYSGTLEPGGSAGTFSFDVSLNAGTGSITNTQMNFVAGGGSQATQSGSAPVSGGNFSIPMEVTTIGNPSKWGPPLGSTGSMDGGFKDGNKVDGTWMFYKSNGDPVWQRGDGQLNSFEGSKN